MLKRWIKSLKEEAQKQLKALDPLSPIDAMEKAPFLQAVINVCEAVVIRAKRHSELAAEMAAKESDEDRKKELLDIARICEWVPEKKAMELLECMWVAMAQFIDLYISPTGGAFNEGYAHWEAVTSGGQTSEGLDAANELTFYSLIKAGISSSASYFLSWV